MPDRRSPFGGHQQIALPWKPLPQMESYLRYMVDQDKSPEYVDTMRTGLAHFGLFAEQEGLRHPGEIERKHLLRFQVWLEETKKVDGSGFLSPSYQKQLLTSLRTWLAWLARTGLIHEDPWVNIKMPKKRQRPTNPLTEDEVQAIFESHMQQAFSISPFYYHRREAILIALFGWGLTPTEMLKLNLSHVDMRLHQIVIPTSTGTNTELPYGDEMKNLFQRWLIQRAKKAVPHEDALFIDQQGGRMAPGSMAKIVTDLGKRAGVHLTPNRLRETFAASLLDSGVDLEQVMRMVGVRNHEQVMRYARPGYDRKLVEAYREAMTPFYERLFRGGEPPKKPKRRTDIYRPTYDRSRW